MCMNNFYICYVIKLFYINKNRNVCHSVLSPTCCMNYTLCMCMFGVPTIGLAGGLPGSMQCMWSYSSDCGWGLVLWGGRSRQKRQR